MSDALERLSNELTEDQAEALLDLADKHREGYVSRRDAIKGAGATALAGGGLASLLTGSAAGATGNAGPVGTPNERVDLYADVADANTVNADDITITNDGSGSGIDADQIEGYDVEKDGSDATGVINFKTS